jgi:Uma2 family endonuclease
MSTLSTSLPLVDRDATRATQPPLRMTEAEFLAWATDDVRAEWVDGEVIIMAAENLIHIDLKYWLVWLLKTFVERRKLGGRVIGSEFIVRLSSQRRLRTPDTLYVSSSREHLIGPTRLEGAPDLAIEIVSPESQSRDRREKFLEYEKAGVREYWIVDPLSQTLEFYALGPMGSYASIQPLDGKVHSNAIPGLYLRPEWLWQSPLPDVIETLREMGIQF